MDLLWIIFISLLFSLFFSGMEIAFISANRLRIELDKKYSTVHSNLISLYTQNPGQFIATLIIGNNLAMVIYGLAFAKLLESILLNYLHYFYLVIFCQMVIATIVIIIYSEYIPKILFRINPNGILRFFTLPVAFFYFLFYPVIKIIFWISTGLVNLTTNEPIRNANEKIVYSRIDLDHLVNETDHNNSSQKSQEINNEVKLFRNALDFSKVKLREIMVPRTEMVALDINGTVDELRQKFIETGYSRILFYSENTDNIVGYVHHSVFFTNPDSIKLELRKVLIVPETMSASKLLSQFIQNRLSIAIVVDEFGGTSGMVTSEDILEEIFGEIEDEHDTIDLIKKMVSDTEFVLSGRLELDELNDDFYLEFPENENFETLAGFILFHYESIPQVNTIIDIGKYKFKILKASNTKIELVHLKILDKT